MTLVKGIFRVLFVLLLQSAIWSLCVCKPIKKEELSPRDDDLFGPYFSQKPLRPQTLHPPFVWPTRKPPVLPTWKPPPVLPTWKPPPVWPTWKPPVWRTWNPPVWTYRPPKYVDRYGTNTSGLPTGVKIFIFIVIGIAGLIALVCKYVCNSDENASESEAIVHPPPATISTANLNRNSPEIQYRVMAPYAGASTSLYRNSSQNNYEEMPSFAAASTRLNRNTQQFQYGTVPIDTGTSDTCNVTDKPPSYSDVVTSDLVDGTLKFPDVSVTAPHESPPPKYEKGDLPKF